MVETETLEEKMRRLLGNRAPLIAEPHVPPGGELIRFPMNCSVHLRPFVIVAEQHGDTLSMLRNELPQANGHGGVGSSLPALGAFRFDCTKWTGCPHCGTRGNPARGLGPFWICNTCQSRGLPAFNCVGSDSGGNFRCACGATVSPTASFVVQETFEVRGIAGTTARRLPPAGASRLANASPTLRLR